MEREAAELKDAETAAPSEEEREMLEALKERETVGVPERMMSEDVICVTAEAVMNTSERVNSPAETAKREEVRGGEAMVKVIPVHSS